jgi:nucleoside-diphosphate-sugar epimerase
VKTARALVLGGGGFVGGAACRELLRRGFETIAAGRKERPSGSFTRYLAFDRTDEDALARALAEARPDVLLDLACYQPAQIEAVARHFKGERYVFTSTGVYPDRHGAPAREDDFVPLAGVPPAALDYLDGKRWCETALRRLGDLPWTVVRPSAVFGPLDQTLRIAAYIQRVADGGPLLVPVETYDQHRGFVVSADDLAAVFGQVCDLRSDVVHKAYNVADDRVTLRELIEAIARVLGEPARMHPVPFAELPEGASPYGPYPNRAGYVVERARRELGFEPSALEDALAATIAWYRAAGPSHPGYSQRENELAMIRSQ